MKRFASAVVFCLSLLGVLSLWLYPEVKAKDDPILALLTLPAPPPPNPLMPNSYAAARTEAFYDKSKPPPDNAPIEDLIDYWSRMSVGMSELRYTPEPSAVVVGRLMSEMERDPTQFPNILNAMPNDRRVENLVRDLYAKYTNSTNESENEQANRMKAWLMENTSDFSTELERGAAKVVDTEHYVSNHREVLAFAKADWDRAEPLVKRLYSNKNGSSTVVLATWALYRQAIRSGAVGDVDRYRSELIKVVEDKQASPGMRDLALDALAGEKEWGGREDWYVSLMEDETLSELNVGGSVYTGLTTLFLNTPSEQMTDRMIGLAGSDNIWVRTAAVKNLVIRLGQIPTGDENMERRKEILKALLPWLSNKDWVKGDRDGRAMLIQALATVKMPEAVPVLIQALDVKEKRPNYRAYANIAANAANAAANAAAYAANAAVANTNRASVEVDSDEDSDLSTPELVLPPPSYANAARNTNSSSYYDNLPMEDQYVLRNSAIEALGFQEDMRAGPALRRILPQVEEYYRGVVISAMLKCNAFTADEKVRAVEYIASMAGDVANAEADDSHYLTDSDDPRKTARYVLSLNRFRSTASLASNTGADEDDDEFDSYGSEREVRETKVYTVANAANYASNRTVQPSPLNQNQINLLAGMVLVADKEPGEDLIHGVATRIEQNDARSPQVAYNLRQIMLGWNGRAANALMLRDLKSGKAESDQILKLLSVRKELREKQIGDVTDIRSGTQYAVGVAACLLEDAADFDAILTTGSDPAKLALLACGRLIRAPLSVEKTSVLLRSPNRALALAAERFLESEDSPQARSVILSMYPDKVRILGSKIAFQPDDNEYMMGTFLRDVFASVNPVFTSKTEYTPSIKTDQDLIASENRVKKELITNGELLGIYAYDGNYVRIFKDKTTFSWEDDPARYREREMDDDEFEYLKNYLAAAHVDELPPFIDCIAECDPKQLLMVGRQGGRRIYLSADGKTPEFFAGLEHFFEPMRARPGKLQYYSSSTVPGLEVVFEDKNLSALSVWKDGADLRVLTENIEVEEKVKKELKRFSDEAYEQSPEDEDETALYQKIDKMREARQYESVAWFSVSDGKAAATTSQPLQVPYVPIQDGSAPSQQFGAWKAKNQTMEIRADETGLYKLAGGHSTRIKTGSYSDPLLTLNGKWIVVLKYSERSGRTPVRINVATGREYPIGDDDIYVRGAVAYIPERNLVIFEPYRYDHDYEEYGERENRSAYDNGRGYILLDPDTGKVTEATGELRPLAHQTFRSLQSTGTPGEYWAALPRGQSGTIFGIYNAKTFTLKPLIKLPQIIFDSSEMWVDQAGGKVYFAYSDQVLRMNLPQQR